MEMQDTINLGRKAKYETEDYINRHLNDRAKGWPKLCLCCSTNTWPNRSEVHPTCNRKRQT